MEDAEDIIRINRRNKERVVVRTDEKTVQAEVT